MTTPPVFGNVRLGRRNADRLESWRRLIVEHCRRERLRLASVMVDSGMSEARRPGWTRLLDRVSSAGGDVVVVLLTLDQLSRNPVRQAEMRAQIYAAGGRVVQVQCH